MLIKNMLEDDIEVAIKVILLEIPCSPCHKYEMRLAGDYNIFNQKDKRKT